jgi:PAS domain S-box-containing protein
MDARDLVFSSPEFLRLIENAEMIGCWSWTFASDRHIWSNGLYRLLGLDAGTVRPSYDLFLELIHPDDRARMESAVEIRRTGALSSLDFRLVRPDGSWRILSSRNEVFFDPDGRPRGASGVVLDVTDKERLLQLRRLDQKRKRALFEQARILMFSLNPAGEFTFPQEAFELTGLSPNEIADDAFLLMVPEEREYWRSLSLQSLQAGIIHTSQPTIHIDRVERGRFETFTVPIRHDDGGIVDWTTVVQPAGHGLAVKDESFRLGLSQHITARHIRAARALLDWSREDLAKAAGLSLSTIRRIESGEHSLNDASRRRIIAACEGNGLSFNVLTSGAIAVAAG